jgi:hypothetical protein
MDDDGLEAAWAAVDAALPAGWRVNGPMFSDGDTSLARPRGRPSAEPQAA